MVKLGKLCTTPSSCKVTENTTDSTGPVPGEDGFSSIFGVMHVKLVAVSLLHD